MAITNWTDMLSDNGFLPTTTQNVFSYTSDTKSFMIVQNPQGAVF